MSGERSSTDRRGFSIPMVVLFCSIMVVVLMAFVQTRVNMKQQTRMTFRQVKAHYLAQSGIQHALLKLRVLPLESYDAASIFRGTCPFGTAQAGQLPANDQAHNGLLNEFISDVSTAKYAVDSYSGDFNPPDWNYSPAKVTALMANLESDNKTLTHAIEIVIDGSLNEQFKGQPLTTTDEVTRVVKISRSR